MDTDHWGAAQRRLAALLVEEVPGDIHEGQDPRRDFGQLRDQAGGVDLGMAEAAALPPANVTAFTDSRQRRGGQS